MALPRKLQLLLAFDRDGESGTTLPFHLLLFTVYVNTRTCLSDTRASDGRGRTQHSDNLNLRI